MTAATDKLLLAEIQMRYEHMCRVEGYGFWCWDVDQDRFDIFGKLWSQLGYSPEELEHIAKNVGFRGFAHPEDIEPVLEDIRIFLSTKRRFDFTFRLQTKQKEAVWVQSCGDAEWDEGGRARLVYGSVVDVSVLISTEEALRESEARHYRIIDASNDGIWEWYAEGGGYFHFSARCWDQLGYTEEDDELNQGQNRFRAWCKLIHPDDVDVFFQHIENYWNTLDRMDVEYRIRAKDGSYRWIRARGKGLLTADGKPWRMSGTNIDITAIKEAEEKVLRAKELAENANRAKSDFLSSMSHELRTPLNSILGFAQLFDYDDNLSSDQRENIREIRKAGNHLLQLINDVLDLSKIEAGEVGFSLEPVFPVRVVEECMALVKPLAASHRVTLRFLPNDGANVYVLADAMRLKQILLNLLSNAIKYNLESGYVEVSLNAKDNGRLAIAVEDSGRGISPSDIKKMYEPFNRLGAERTNIEGTGVGLLITRRLIEMMGGQLECESVEGVGSMFTVLLSIAEDRDVQTKSQFKHLDVQGESAVDLSLSTPKNILYIEDNRSNIRAMEQFCARFDYLTLEVAEEPFLGLYKARSGNPDLIVMDINLPGMDGFDALSVLQKDTSTQHVPVVALSANALSQDVDRGVRAGFYAYLTKPLEVSKLIRVLNTLWVEPS